MSDKFVVALGYFDSVHIGHEKVINEAVSYAKKVNAKVVVFTFSGNLRAFFKGETEKQIYTASEKEKIMLSLGVSEVFFAPVNKTFLNKGRLAFLNYVNKKYNVCAYVCGEDYTFGKSAKGNVSFLKDYANRNNQSVITVLEEKLNGEKISTSKIKKHLKNGKVDKANELLGRAYSICGNVYKDRGVGKKIGFPTANVKVDAKKQALKNGVYAGKVIVGDKEYGAIINYGARPTFSLSEIILEAHLFGFNANLYGKNIEVYFEKFIRDVLTFSSKDELIRQIEKDVKKAKGIV